MVYIICFWMLIDFYNSFLNMFIILSDQEVDHADTPNGKTPEPTIDEETTVAVTRKTKKKRSESA